MSADTGSAFLYEFCQELARGAGAVASSGRARGFAVSTKSSPTDVVTEVDRTVETWLIDAIRERRPEDAVLGEEGGGRSGTSGVRWIVDPIDGTVNFLLGIPSWAVSVAVERDGVIVAGCVYNPTADETFHARLGGGAFLGAQALRGPRAVSLDRAVVGTGFGYSAARRAAQGQIVAALLPQVADIRRIGSASLDLCAMAAGRLDAYFEVGLNPWDWSAGLLVATEAGCVGSGLHGRPPGTEMTAVAAPALAPEFFARLEELGADGVAAISG
jgi:fructose-1,6-bisphosphatase/inositol monophosphatase family enzyme